MPKHQMRGVYVILCTPFDEDGEVDVESLHREVQFCVDSGVHGVVTPANASEFWTLSDNERKLVLRTVISEMAGRVPVVAGVTAGSAWTSVALAADAEEAGADAVMAMPPYGIPAPRAVVFDYYRRLSDSISIPIFIQNHEPPMGTRLAADLIARLVTELDRVEYIKEETYPPGRAMSAEFEKCGDALKGVMGGIGGRYIFDEYRRGACGTMPACAWADVWVRIWDSLEAGEEDAARETFNQLLPILNYEVMWGIPLYKEILKRRGVFRTNYLRSVMGNPLDEHDLRELDRLLEGISPLVTQAQPA
jgi:dihydrodipicolinate synthase/N-acetylneuraminate lyase